MKLEVVILIYFALMSLMTFVIWGRDKARAKKGARRFSETLMLGLCALGGTPGGWLGAFYFSHKRKKQSFMTRMYWITAAQFLLFIALTSFGII